MPHAMNNAANRFGNGPGAPAVVVGLPQTGTDSSQGNVIVTPTPRRKVRLEMESRRGGWDELFGLGKAFIGHQDGKYYHRGPPVVQKS